MRVLYVQAIGDEEKRPKPVFGQLFSLLFRMCACRKREGDVATLTHPTCCCCCFRWRWPSEVDEAGRPDSVSVSRCQATLFLYNSYAYVCWPVRFITCIRAFLVVSCFDSGHFVVGFAIAASYLGMNGCVGLG